MAAVPIAIHLLTSRASVRQDFPALAFLRRAHAGTARRARLRDFLLLLLRILAVLALVIALSGPYWRGGGAAGAPVVVVLDASASMQQRHLGASSWDHAVAAVARLSEELGDRPMLLLVAGSTVQRSGLMPSLDRGPVRALLATAKPRWGSGGNDQAVALALPLLDHGGDLYVVGDGSRSFLGGIDPQAMPAGVSLHLLDAGGGGANQAVKAVALEPGVAVVGRPCTVRAEIANYADQAVRLTVVVACGSDSRQSSHQISAGGSVIVAESFTPSVAGDLPVSATIVARENGADHFAADDLRQGIVSVRATLPVAVFSDGDARQSEGALKPLLAGLSAAGLAPTFQAGNRLAFLPALAVDDGAAVVVTASLAAVPDTRALVNHLLAGGALIQVVVSDADAALAAALSGMDPPLKTLPLVDLSNRRRGIGLGERDLNHPLLEGLRGREPLLSQVEALRYRPATLGVGGHLLLAWEDGSVALAERHVGTGRWLMLNASPADRDTNLAALEVLPLLTARIGQVLLPRRRDDCALPCGMLLSSSLPLTHDDGHQVSVIDGAVRLEDPGFYRDGRRVFTAAIAAHESDLRTVASPAGSSTSSTVEAVAMASSNPWWPWVLLLALAFLAGETWLAGGLRERQS